MKKKLLLSAVILGALSFSSVVLAAANPFTSVPKDHWAYSAVEKLVQAGLVDGYGDADFRGEKAISRYEMAVLVAKAMSNVNKADDANKVSLEKLKTEFSDELSNLGVRVNKLEQNASSFKWFGDARFRYQTNYNNDMRNDDKTPENSHRIQQRLRLGIYGNIADNLEVVGRLKIENTTNNFNGWKDSNGNYNRYDASGAHNSAYLDLLGLNWTNNDLKLSTGRIPITIGQGIIWSDNPVDGIYATYKVGKASVSAGWGDLTAENWKDYSMNAFLANVSVPLGERTTVTVGHLKTNSSENKLSTMRDDYGNGTWKAPFSLDQYAYGFNTKMKDNLSLLVEGVTNRASDLPDNAQKNGWWSRLTYGNQDWKKANTYNVYLEYLSLGNWAVDSTGWGHILNVAGGNGLGNDGDKGWGIGVSYMLASNTNLEVNYYKLKPYDEHLSGFSDYKNTYNAALSFSF